MAQAFSALSALQHVVASIAADPPFADLEVLKTNVRRERGAYVVSLVVDRAGGVDTNDCEIISRHLIRRIDTIAPDLQNYRIEVASAGLDRPLLEASHYRRFSGRIAKVITTLRIANRTEFTGAIGAVTEDAVTIEDPHAGSTPIPYAAIKRANLVYEPSEDLKRKRS
jgi:ribosome maturation factor RimP